ncbi:MAG TPA: secondary thiamine-phosphate synthase enzyme YjbQ [Nitrososphaeraceae archaeon]|jgi:secondary thiamine-phosphate synthase enzyme|nr:secondary thiamine-phosphate synthase enzyme YjbQ [Nitrososphaeraceae archaeon]
MMTVITKTIEIKSKGENDMVDITDKTLKAIFESKLENGIVTIFVSGSTAAVTTIEYEAGLRKDFPMMLNRIIPKDIEYKHNETWHDGNGHSHVRASLIGPSLTVPFKDGNLILGTWQQIVFCELDTRSRERRITLQIIGE